MDNLILALHEFQKLVAGDGQRMARRFHFFSTSGKPGCPYTARSRKLFVADEYPAIRKQFLELLEKFREVEGDGFGK